VATAKGVRGSSCSTHRPSKVFSVAGLPEAEVRCRLQEVLQQVQGVTVHGWATAERCDDSVGVCCGSPVGGDGEGSNGRAIAAAGARAVPVSDPGVGGMGGVNDEPREMDAATTVLARGDMICSATGPAAGCAVSQKRARCSDSSTLASASAHPPPDSPTAPGRMHFEVRRCMP
jgi:hypothetical protein